MPSLELQHGDALLAPLPDGGAGDTSAFRDVRGDFERLTREEDPHSFPEGDPRRENPKKADWQGVVDLAESALRERSKDVRIAAWLTVGLTQLERFAGLRDGLRLLNRLVTDCWDREGRHNADSSCWIRVASPWAGKQWGAVHVPRVGQEVVVDFLEGDPDDPIIVGSVYNADQMPPYGL